MPSNADIIRRYNTHAKALLARTYRTDTSRLYQLLEAHPWLLFTPYDQDRSLLSVIIIHQTGGTAEQIAVMSQLLDRILKCDLYETIIAASDIYKPPEELENDGLPLPTNPKPNDVIERCVTDVVYSLIENKWYAHPEVQEQIESFANVLAVKCTAPQVWEDRTSGCRLDTREMTSSFRSKYAKALWRSVKVLCTEEKYYGLAACMIRSFGCVSSGIDAKLERVLLDEERFPRTIFLENVIIYFNEHTGSSRVELSRLTPLLPWIMRFKSTAARSIASRFSALDYITATVGYESVGVSSWPVYLRLYLEVKRWRNPKEAKLDCLHLFMNRVLIRIYNEIQTMNVNDVNTKLDYIGQWARLQVGDGSFGPLYEKKWAGLSEWDDNEVSSEVYITKRAGVYFANGREKYDDTLLYSLNQIVGMIINKLTIKQQNRIIELATSS